MAILMHKINYISGKYRNTCCVCVCVGGGGGGRLRQIVLGHVLNLEQLFGQRATPSNAS